MPGGSMSRFPAAVPRRLAIVLLLVVLSLAVLFRIETPSERYPQRRSGISLTSTVSLCNRTLRATAKFIPEGYDLSTHQLNCAQLTRSIQNWTIPPLPIPDEPNENEWTNTVLIQDRRRTMTTSSNTAEGNPALIRLAHKLSSSKTALKILVIGGSMTAGVELSSGKEMAWPEQFLQLLTSGWHDQDTDGIVHSNNISPRFQLSNIAVGGADENYWIANIHAIINELPVDIILVESAINDQCYYDEVEAKAPAVSLSSTVLLNQLVRLRGAPAVVNVELFRTAGADIHDARSNCRGHVRQLTNPTTDYYFCPQWWLPQDWRTSARDANHVPAISYRDAVWPIQDRPPKELPHYWEGGKSHPNPSSHYLIATMLFFSFCFAREHAHLLLLTDSDNTVDDAGMETLSQAQRPPEQSCYVPISDWSFRSVAGATEAMPHIQLGNDPSCWQFYEDAPGKYGCICEISASSDNNDMDAVVESTLLRIGIRVGGEGKVLLNRLVSYDERMASIGVWFGARANPNVHAFAGAPVWTINAWHSERTSIPVTQVLWLPRANSMNAAAGLHWAEGLPVRDDDDDVRSTGEQNGPPSVTVELTMNIEMIRFSSNATTTTNTNNADAMAARATDKFKLLSITTC